jgi:hypothetical protein
MHATAVGTSAVQVWTLVIAALAVVATIVSAILLRRTGKGSVRAAEKAADASERSAAAAEKSALAAQEAVGVSRETASGVAERAEADALTTRYQEAAAQLGHESPAVRLAGAYALAKLADDWPDQRQVCIDVICAYLRAPWPSQIGHPEVGDRSEEMVRASILELISNHLRGQSDAPSWRDARFDFSGATFRDFRLHNIAFGFTPNFSGAIFEGESVFDLCMFKRGATFDYSHVRGSLSFDNVFVSGGLTATPQGFFPQLSFNGAVVEETGCLTLRPRTIAEEAKIVAFNFDIAGRLVIDRRPMKEPFGNFLFEGVRFKSTARIDIDSQFAAYSPDFGDEGYGRAPISFLDLTTLDGAQVTVHHAKVKVPRGHWRP